MGRGKRNKTVKRRKHLFDRIFIRRKMGKKVFFTLTHCSKKLSGISNRYNYKSNMHRLCYVNAKFNNVKYQASIITGCNFRDAKLNGVDFYNTNLKGSSFKNAIIRNTVFYNCKLNDVEFLNVKFDNVIFVCTNLDKARNLDINDKNIVILRTYPNLNLDSEVEKILLSTANKQSIYKARVLHVNREKLNMWNLAIIQSYFSDNGIEMLARILSKKTNWQNLYTVHSYISLIENWNKK